MNKNQNGVTITILVVTIIVFAIIGTIIFGVKYLVDRKNARLHEQFRQTDLGKELAELEKEIEENSKYNDELRERIEAISVPDYS